VSEAAHPALSKFSLFSLLWLHGWSFESLDREPVTSAAILDAVVDSLINDVKSILEEPVLDATSTSISLKPALRETTTSLFPFMPLSLSPNFWNGSTPSLPYATLMITRTFSVDGRVEICCTTFNDLREGTWLDNWMLMAGIQMSDKPHFIRYGDVLLPCAIVPVSARYNPFDARRLCSIDTILRENFSCARASNHTWTVYLCLGQAGKGQDRATPEPKRSKSPR
jgi:hypothetical protein